MLQELNAVRDQLMSDGNDDLRQSIYTALTEEPERGTNMIISFARDKELKLDASPQEVVQAIQAIGEQLDDDEISDMELTQEELESVSGGIFPFILAAKAFIHLGLAGAQFWAAGKSARIW